MYNVVASSLLKSIWQPAAQLPVDESRLNWQLAYGWQLTINLWVNVWSWLPFDGWRLNWQLATINRKLTSLTSNLDVYWFKLLCAQIKRRINEFFSFLNLPYFGCDRINIVTYVRILQSADAPLTEDQLDEVMTKLDTDGDGEVDLG